MQHLIHTALCIVLLQVVAGTEPLKEIHKTSNHKRSATWAFWDPLRRRDQENKQQRARERAVSEPQGKNVMSRLNALRPLFRKMNKDSDKGTPNEGLSESSTRRGLLSDTEDSVDERGRRGRPRSRSDITRQRSAQDIWDRSSIATAIDTETPPARQVAPEKIQSHDEMLRRANTVSPTPMRGLSRRFGSHQMSPCPSPPLSCAASTDFIQQSYGNRRSTSPEIWNTYFESNPLTPPDSAPHSRQNSPSTHLRSPFEDVRTPLPVKSFGTLERIMESSEDNVSSGRNSHFGLDVSSDPLWMEKKIDSAIEAVEKHCKPHGINAKTPSSPLECFPRITLNPSYDDTAIDMNRIIEPEKETRPISAISSAHSECSTCFEGDHFHLSKLLDA